MASLAAEVLKEDWLHNRQNFPQHMDNRGKIVTRMEYAGIRLGDFLAEGVSIGREHQGLLQGTTVVARGE
jgi:hypothetical protein